MYKAHLVILYSCILFTGQTGAILGPSLYDVMNVDAPLGLRQFHTRLFSKRISRELTQSILPRVIDANNQLFRAAYQIPDYMSPSRRGLGALLIAPVQLGAIASSLAAPILVRYLIGRPVNAFSRLLSSRVDDLRARQDAGEGGPRIISGIKSALTAGTITAATHFLRHQLQRRN